MTFPHIQEQASGEVEHDCAKGGDANHCDVVRQSFAIGCVAGPFDALTQLLLIK
jgi:hypothetical protein